ncbi:MAG: DNA-binding transcriptional LysR family regulator [Myxococcota bacterium]|jgi:DNA-binding transcriptional LysR family regulator
MAQPPLDSWDDARIFLAVARAGSVRKAALELGVSRPTVARRLEALEQRLGLRLFDRASDGLHATSAAEALRPSAERAEQAMLAMARAAQAADQQMRGPIRVTLPGVVAAGLLMDDLVAFSARWPLVTLDISGSYDLSSLARREADVAIRFMPPGKTPEGDLVGRHVATAYMAIYGQGTGWIGHGNHEADLAWIRDTPFPKEAVRANIINGEIIRSACARGLGKARLPCFIAEPGLTRRTEPEPGLDIWVLVHSDLRRNPRLRAFRDAMVRALTRLRPRLEGRSHP